MNEIKAGGQRVCSIKKKSGRKKIEKLFVTVSCTEIAVGLTQTKNKETQNLVKEYRKYFKI